MFSGKSGSEDSKTKKGRCGEQLDRPVFLMTVQNVLDWVACVAIFFFFN